MSKSSRPTFDQICHHLVSDPFHLSIDQIRKLTPYQVRHVYFREKEQPQLPPHPGASKGKDKAPSSFELAFKRLWKDKGFSDTEVNAKWQAQVDANKGKK